ncbi:MAG: hypothetical protein IK128_00265 [Clostridiales bacterium]|nr:hypothetical protein [Clostridiales bacterium]
MKMTTRILSAVIIVVMMFSFAACNKNKIPDVETVSRYSDEELRALAETVDEKALIDSWGEPQIANNERLWPVDLSGVTKYMVAYVEDGKVISLNFSKTMFINVILIRGGVTYCTFGWDNYSSDSANFAFMPTQDIFGNPINCEVGDQILFESDGMVAETYPAQLAAPYSVRVMGHLSEEEIAEMIPFQQMSSGDIESFKNQTSFSWDDFSIFVGEDIGSGLFVYRYDLLDGGYLLVSGTSLDQDPQQVLFSHPDGTDEVIYQDPSFVGATPAEE